MPTRLLNPKQLKAGWAGLSAAIREIAARTDRGVQFARLRLTLLEVDRELQMAYRLFGQRTAELVLAVPTPPDNLDPDDPELQRLAGIIVRIQARMDHLTQQLAALDLEAPAESTQALRQRLHAAGFIELAAVIAGHSPHARTQLDELKPLRECVITAIIRNGAPFVPTGSTALLPGDEIVIFGPAVACEQAKMFLEQTLAPDYPQAL